MKPELKYEDGKLKAKIEVGVDSDKDGILAAGLASEFFIDAKEALNEIFKSGIPEWAKKIIEKAQPQEQVAAVEAPKAEAQA